MSPDRAPRDNIVRALYSVGEVPIRGLEMRAAEAGGMPTMFGHFAVFNRWTEIDSIWEGKFMERIAPGAFKKTFRENRSAMRVLFQHGMDFSIGDKPIASIRALDEDDNGAFYEAPLIDARYVRDDILPGLEAGVYGASFRFSVMKEQWLDEPKSSENNPKGLPERTIQEARVAEFGPVTFPAYPDATAGVRSLTDMYALRQFARDPKSLELLEGLRAAALPPDGAGDTHSEPEEEPGSDPTPAESRTEPVIPVARPVLVSIPDDEWDRYIERENNAFA